MVTRVTGSSGMDIESIVKSMMAAKRVPLDKLNQQKTMLNWTRDSYREINSKLYDFKTNKLSKYGLSSEMNGYKSTLTGDTSAIKAEATAEASTIPMRVTVEKLATQATLETQGLLGKGLTKFSSLEEVQKAHAEQQAAYNAAHPGAEVPITPAASTYDLYINDQKFSFANTLSISEVISQINASTTALATASFDEITGKLSLSSKAFGQENGSLKLTNAAGSNLLGIFGGGPQENGVPVVEFKGTDAELTVNGTKMTKDSNTFSVNGVLITLLEKSKDSNNPSVISTQSDSTKPMETIKNFVAAYNEILTSMYAKTSEERYRSFQPLTDEQRNAMNETDINNWEKKAKSGLMKDDSILKEMLAKMRSEISSRMGDLSAIGITTGKYYENGKLIIDEKKLKTALEKDPQAVMDLFQGSAGAPYDGIIDKLGDVADSAMGRLAEKAGTSKFSGDVNAVFKTESIMGKLLTNYNKRIDAMQKRLLDQENRYYKQFGAMESAMSKLNAQSNSLFAGKS